MPEKRQYRAIKGTRDILPPDSALWNRVEQIAREVFESYNFRDIRTPAFEDAELFARSIGMDTDVVSKEMYAFEDRESGSLVQLKETIRLASSLGTNVDAIRPFINDARRFADAAELALKSGEIPTDSYNAKLIGGLAYHVSQFSTLIEVRDGNPLRDQLIEASWLGITWLVNLIKIGDFVALRPEATASVARAYVEHGMHALPGNQKLYYIGPMFRRERPQKGRYRQFYQIGAEVLGQSDAPAIDAEVLEMLVVLFKRVGLTKTTLYVNSIGCKECRPKYVELLREELRRVQSQLGPDSQRRIETNPLRVLDSKIPDEQAVIEKLPRISDHLCDDCLAHFARLKEELGLREVAYQENWRLVRGLDYYTRTTFEVTAEGLGSQNAVCGGGRYDGLIELLGGQPTKGIGFAIGTDRAILSLQEGQNAPRVAGLSVFIAWMSAATYPTAVRIARQLRALGVAVELPPEEMKFKKSLGLADKLGARYALIIGEDEVASGSYTLKRLADAEQKKLNEGELLEYLESERRGSSA